MVKSDQRFPPLALTLVEHMLMNSHQISLTVWLLWPFVSCPWSITWCWQCVHIILNAFTLCVINLSYFNNIAITEDMCWHSRYSMGISIHNFIIYFVLPCGLQGVPVPTMCHMWLDVMSSSLSYQPLLQTFITFQCKFLHFSHFSHFSNFQ